MITSLVPNSARRKASAFTLIELLTVVAILVILMTITVAIMRNAQQTGARKKTEGQLSVLVGGIGNYYDFYNEYPEPLDNTGEGGDGAKALYQALSGDGTDMLVTGQETVPSDGEIGTEGEVFVEGLDPNSNKHGLVNTRYELVDPYGQRWRYQKYISNDDPDSKEMRNRTFDLWSVAEDSEEDNEAKWIKNW